MTVSPGTQHSRSRTSQGECPKADLLLNAEKPLTGLRAAFLQITSEEPA
jgi:hypothetical protein